MLGCAEVERRRSEYLVKIARLGGVNTLAIVCASCIIRHMEANVSYS